MVVTCFAVAEMRSIPGISVVTVYVGWPIHDRSWTIATAANGWSRGSRVLEEKPFGEFGEPLPTMCVIFADLRRRRLQEAANRLRHHGARRLHVDTVVEHDARQRLRRRSRYTTNNVAPAADGIWLPEPALGKLTVLSAKPLAGEIRVVHEAIGRSAGHSHPFWIGSRRSTSARNIVIVYVAFESAAGPQHGAFAG